MNLCGDSFSTFDNNNNNNNLNIGNINNNYNNNDNYQNDEDDQDENGEDELQIKNFFIEMCRPIDRAYDPPVIDLPLVNAFKLRDFMRLTVRTILTHPRQLMCELIRIGYEPLPGRPGRAFSFGFGSGGDGDGGRIFGLHRKPCLHLPGFFPYMLYIVKRDGMLGVFRGLHFNIAYNALHCFVFKNVFDAHSRLRPLDALIRDPARQMECKRNFALSLAVDSVARAAAHVATFPLKLITIRAMTQFVAENGTGDEMCYGTLRDAIAATYRAGAIQAFYAGFVPYVLADFVSATIRWIVFYANRSREKSVNQKSTKSFKWDAIINIGATLLVSCVDCRLRTIATVMIVNASVNTAASRYTGPFVYDDWWQCAKSLWRRGELSRGSTLFWRTAPADHVDSFAND